MEHLRVTASDIHAISKELTQTLHADIELVDFSPTLSIF